MQFFDQGKKKSAFFSHRHAPVNESFSFLVRPETISELVDAASGRSKSPQESTRSTRRLMKEAVRRGRIKTRSSSMLARGRERRREERLMMRSTGTDLEVGKPLVSREPKMEVSS